MISNVLYRIISFADYSNISYSPSVISLLKDKFGSGYTFNQLPEPLLNGNLHFGINMISPDMSIHPNINLGSMRIEMAMASNKKTGFDDEDLTNAKKSMINSFSILYSLFSEVMQDANRLACISNYAFFEIDENEMYSFKERFLKPLGYYNDKSTTEFMAKYAGLDSKQINGREEKLNVISTLYRLFQNQGAPIDGYGLELDINTVAENKKTRFSFDSFDDFVSIANSIKTIVVGDVFHGCR